MLLSLQAEDVFLSGWMTCRIMVRGGLKVSEPGGGGNVRGASRLPITSY